MARDSADGVVNILMSDENWITAYGYLLMASQFPSSGVRGGRLPGGISLCGHCTALDTLIVSRRAYMGKADVDHVL